MRGRSERSIVLGLTALAVEDCTCDSRDSTIALSLVFHSAQKIGVNVSDVFHGVAATAGQQGSHLLTSFLKRDPAQQGLGVFGFREGTNGDGEFCYADAV